jgi:hypothetical protein
MLGRPRLFRDEDVDQLLLSGQNETDSNTAYSKYRLVSNLRVEDGPVFHAKFVELSLISSMVISRNKSNHNADRIAGWQRLSEGYPVISILQVEP